mmetsp:Transcript_104546/g.265371  ORF Transcript_104546/g.265371 Transcript_104546/m.265371 type:complete len:204 (-) Transcript_104546:3-614(-)
MSASSERVSAHLEVISPVGTKLADNQWEANPLTKKALEDLLEHAADDLLVFLVLSSLLREHLLLQLEVHIVYFLLVFRSTLLIDHKERGTGHLVSRGKDDALALHVTLISDHDAVNLFNQLVLHDLLPDEIALLASAAIGIDLLDEGHLGGESPGGEHRRRGSKSRPGRSSEGRDHGRPSKHCVKAKLATLLGWTQGGVNCGA